MSRIRFAFALSIIFLFPLFLSAQKIDSMMNVYAERYPQEKAYVQFDKNVYNPGETIWFKAYLFSGADLSAISKNFYAELSDENGNIIQRKVSPLFESTTAGSFDIPSAYKGHHLHFRGYTSWMLNFDTAFLFEKDIRLLNALKDSSSSATLPAPEGHFQFFPEGGDVIASVENNIAFKATDQYGRPIKVTGVLKDASGKDILEFNSVHDGMGKFLITPEKNDVFYAVWKDEKGVEHKTDFPAIKPGGVALRMMPGNKKVFFSVARSAEGSDEYNKITVIGHMNQQLVYKAIVNLQDNFMSGGSIPTDQLPSGILQFTAFSSNNLPLAERVIFINNHAFEFSPTLMVTQKGLTKRGKNALDIVLPDTLHSNLSIAITDADADGKKTNDDNIISRLLLTGDIKGYVYDPGFYFSNSSDSVTQYLDLVMLTHGWRRFKWDQLALGKTPVIKFYPEDYLSINAQVLGIDASRISKDENMNVILQKKDSSIQMLNVPKISGNKFALSGLMFYDTVKAYYQFNINHQLSNQAAVVVNNGLVTGNRKAKPVIQTFTGWTAADSILLRRNKFIADEVARTQPDLAIKAKTLATVTVTGRSKSLAQKLDEEYTSAMFAGGDAYTFDIMNDQSSVAYPDIFTYLQGRVAGLIINANGPDVSMQWRGSTPTVFLNEMKVDVSQIRSITVSDVAMVKVFRPGTGVAFGGGAGGAIAVYTKKGKEARNAPDPNIKGLEQARLIGYSISKEFYSPDYAQRIDLNDVEDLRSTIYWSPYVIPDKGSKKATIEFYNNDFSRKLRVVIEGINSNGQVARIEKIIQ